MCAKPYREGVAEYGCGQCLPCRINRRRLWTARLMLEAHVTDGASFFVTLTYDQEHLPKDGSLEPRDLQLFLKRIRERVAPRRIRFYAVGEYGDRSFRPHYHLVLFGLGDASVVEHCWTLGRVHCGEVTEESCAYVVSYTLKRMTGKDDPRLGGRVPEFARMSLRPGVGAAAMEVVGDALMTKAGSMYVARSGDVSSVLRSSMRMWPLGRYLRRKLRERVGMDPGEPVAVSGLRSRALADELVVPGAREAREGKRLQQERRAKILASISQSKKGFGL